MSGRTWSRIGLLLAFAPFLIFCLMFELIPTFALLLGSVGGVEKHSFEWIGKVFTNATFQRSILNSLLHVINERKFQNGPEVVSVPLAELRRDLGAASPRYLHDVSSMLATGLAVARLDGAPGPRPSASAR